MTPTDLDQLQRQADDELSRRSVKGIWAVPIVVGIFYLTTNFVRDHTAWAVGGGLVIAISLFGRVWTRIRRAQLYSRSPRLWRACFAASSLLGAITGGVLIAIASISYPPTSSTRMILLFCVLSSCPPSIILLTPNRTLLGAMLIAVLGPLIVVEAISHTQEGLIVALMTVAFLAFLEVQGYVLNRAYWSGLKDRLLLEHARDEAEAATLAKSQFLANVSHELRTPMNGILGMTAIALENPLTGEQRECMETVKSCADHLQRLLNDLLDFSRIDAGRVSLNRSPFSPHKMVQETVKVFGEVAAAKGIALIWDTARELPDEVIGDAIRLRQILVNLIGNAIKFTESGEVKVAVEAGQSGDGFELHFRVSDTGIGVAEDKRAVIFQPFTQADGSATRRYGGTGLGLAICGRLVALMNGRIWVESTVGSGSTFHFTVQCEPGKPASKAIKAA